MVGLVYIMKHYQKKLVIILNLVCVINIITTVICCSAVSASNSISSEQFNVRVTRENFAEFCDSLVIPDEKQKLKLDPLFFENFNLLTGNYEYKDIFSVHNEKFKPDVLKAIRKKQAEENANNSSNSSISVYNIDLSKQRQNVQIINVNNNPKISTNSFMYSMMGVDEDNIEFNFEKTVEKVKVLIAKNDFSNAAETLNFLRTKSKKNNSHLFILAGLYEKTNRPDEACSLYKEISEAEPAKYEYIYSYAVSLYKNDNKGLAEKYFLKVTEIKPDFMYAYYNLGNLYYKKVNYYKALDCFNKAMEINPSNSDVCFNIAVTLEVLDHKTLAKKFYSKCLELNPQDAQAGKALERLE
ncbi:MAG: tetratricopeptide repeat protein [bacterium]